MAFLQMKSIKYEEEKDAFSYTILKSTVVIISCHLSINDVVVMSRYLYWSAKKSLRLHGDRTNQGASTESGRNDLGFAREVKTAM